MGEGASRFLGPDGVGVRERPASRVFGAFSVALVQSKAPNHRRCRVRGFPAIHVLCFLPCRCCCCACCCACLAIGLEVRNSEKRKANQAKTFQCHHHHGGATTQTTKWKPETVPKASLSRLSCEVFDLFCFVRQKNTRASKTSKIWTKQQDKTKKEPRMRLHHHGISI